MKVRSSPASLSFEGQVTKQATVKWSIDTCKDNLFNNLLNEPFYVCHQSVLLQEFLVIENVISFPLSYHRFNSHTHYKTT